MKSSNPYLFFNGECKKAMEFYQKTFGGDLSLMKVADAKQDFFKDYDQNLVLHSTLQTPAFKIMASDNMKKDTSVGDNVCVYLECSSREEIDSLYSALLKGGEKGMQPEETFWGAYFGSLTDAFGISWMFSCAL